MKSILLTALIAICYLFESNAQIKVQGISPSSIVSSYGFTWSEPLNGWASPDFNIPGNFVQDTLALADDGTPGVNPLGHAIANEGCASIVNSVAGKIAVVYRGSCEFSLKALNAQQAGAVGLIMINNDDNLTGILGGIYGMSVTIPVVVMRRSDGEALLNVMQNESVVMFMGNQLGAANNDVGAIENEVLISPYGGAILDDYDGFNPGLIVYNYGNNTQTNVTVNATITGPSGIVYNQTIGPLNLNMGESDTLLPSHSNAFPPFDLGAGNYPVGAYNLTYTLGMGVPDELDVDNSFSFDFLVGNQSLSYSRINAFAEPVADNTFPSNATSEYQSCMVVRGDNFNGRDVYGMYFIPHADTGLVDPTGSEIFGNMYEWTDGWVDLNDPNYSFNPLTNDAFQNLTLVNSNNYIIASPNETDQVAYVSFPTPSPLQNNMRYLFCMQTFDPINISFGYDRQLNYTGNVDNSAQPVGPVKIDGEWYVTGWLDHTAPSIAIDVDSICVNASVTPLYSDGECPGLNNGALAIQVSGYGNATINWDNGDMGDTITGLSIGSYTATISGSNGCLEEVTLDVDTLFLEPIVQIQDESCAGTADGFIDITSVTNATAPLTYAWVTGENTASITDLDDGTYTVTVTDAIGCQTTEDYIIEESIPNFGVNITADTTWGPPPLEINFVNLTFNPSDYDFTWYFGDGNSMQTDLPNVQHIYANIGIYDVSLVAVDTSNGCTDSTVFNGYIAVNDNVSLNELQLERKVRLYPNPNEGPLKIETEGFVGKLRVTITNVQGQVVAKQSTLASTFDLDLSSVDSGIYLIEVSDESSRVLQRLVKK